MPCSNSAFHLLSAWTINVQSIVMVMVVLCSDKIYFIFAFAIAIELFYLVLILTGIKSVKFLQLDAFEIDLKSIKNHSLDLIHHFGLCAKIRKKFNIGLATRHKCFRYALRIFYFHFIQNYVKSVLFMRWLNWNSRVTQISVVSFAFIVQCIQNRIQCVYLLLLLLLKDLNHFCMQ